MLTSAGGKPLAIATGLDFGAVIAFAREMGAVTPLFIDLLPEIEAIIVRGINRDDDEPLTLEEP